MASSRVSPDLPRIRLSSVHSRTNSQVSDKYVTPAYHKLDPLLSNLSPEATIQALSSTDTLPIHEKGVHDILTKSISEVSPAERALGIRAAIAAQNLSIWLEEVQAWQWPKGRDAEHGKGFEPPQPVSGDDDTKNGSSAEVEGEYYGSIPAELVETYEARLEEIRDGVDALGVDELKEHVLNAHIPARSRPSSSTSTTSVPPPLSYVQLSDFTAVVTATILRALPLLSRLNRLLSVWDVRLLVLRQIPGLLRGLRLTRLALDTSAASLHNLNPPNENDDLYSRSTFRARHADLEAAVAHVGRRMDRILDTLEGREDSLPETWIDELEGLETDFSTWVVEAERRALENEWNRQRTVTRHDVRGAIGKQDSVQNSGSELDLGRSTGPAVMETIDEEVSCEPTDTHSDELTLGLDCSKDRDASSSMMNSEATHDGPVNVAREGAVPAVSIPEVAPSWVPQSVQGGITEDASFEREARTGPTNDSEGLLAPESLEPAPGRSLDPAITPDNENISDSAQCEETLRSAALSIELQSPPLSAGTVGTQAAYPDIEGTDTSEPSHAAAATGVVLTAVTDGEINPQTVVASACAFVQHGSVTPQPTWQERSMNGTALDGFGVPDPATSAVEPSFHAVWPTEAEEKFKGNQSDSTLPQMDPTVPHASEQLEYLEEVSQPRIVEATPEHHELDDSGLTDGPVPFDTSHDPAMTCDKNADLVEPLAAPVPACASSAQPSTRPLPDANNMSNARAISDHDSTNTVTEPIVRDERTLEPTPPKKKLDSPIKMSKLRPRRLNLNEDIGLGHRRHVSDVSARSSMSDHPSFGSSIDLLEPKTASSNDTHFLLPTPPFLSMDFSSAELESRKGGSSPRDKQFLELHGRSPGKAVKHNRTVSLPLQRFMSATEDVGSDNPLGSETQPQPTEEGSSACSTKCRASYSQTGPSAEAAVQHAAHEVASYLGNLAKNPGTRAPPQKTSVGNKYMAEARVSATRTHTGHAPSSTVSSKNLPRLSVGKKRLTAHPSLEFLGRWESQTRHAGIPVVAAEKGNLELRSSLPVRKARMPLDALDRKINSILSTISADIQLVSSEERDSDESSMGSAFVPHHGGRFQSLSPVGTPSRSSTPNGPFSTPHASRRRHSHAPVLEGNSVKVYHLHRSGKSIPQKLFIRSVGENGERVMVRVGGGWADLGEYLREFAIHHGRRRVSETTPRVEVQDLSPSASPLHPSPGNRHTPRSSLGRTTPSRPQSVLDYQTSSLKVRKTRPARNVASVFDSNDSEVAESPFSPPAFLSQSKRRLSVCSNRSVSAASYMGDTPSAPSVPLGLAGPLPRSRHVSMSPESEAWVEDVLGQARVNTAKPSRNGVLYVKDQEREPGQPRRPLPKARSVSDMGMASLSKRVVLRGLQSRKD